MNTHKWNAKDYMENSSVQQKWAMELIDKVGLKGNETVLDIGCGDGKITAYIADKLPRGSIIGIDNSKEMINFAKKSFSAKNYRNLSFKFCDAKAMFFENRFDIVFSNATLHWIKNHIPVLKGIREALKKSGKVFLQMGGKGNAGEIIRSVDLIRKRMKFKRYFTDFTFPYKFYDPDKYNVLLARAGLEIIYVKLINKDMVHKSADGLKGWIRTTWFPYIKRLPESLRNIFIDETVNDYIEKHPLDSSGFTHVAMVRLEILAKKEK